MGVLYFSYHMQIYITVYVKDQEHNIGKCIG